MIIFIRRIPKQADVNLLRIFVNRGLRGSLFHKTGYILNCQILQITADNSCVDEYYGLVEIDSEKAARRAIKYLNGKTILGRPVAVREFVSRSAYNERRQDYYSMKLYSPDRRMADRRRYLEFKVTNQHISFSSDSRFTKIHYGAI